MRRSTQILAAAIAVFGGMCAIGCSIDPDLDPFEDLYTPDPCEGTTPELNGSWNITGAGKRGECRDDFLNTSKFNLSSATIHLVYDADSGEWSVGNLLLHTNFQVKSVVIDRACVEFTTVEGVGDQTIEYRWKGHARSDELLEGEFTGSGPSGCAATGTFSMSRAN